MNSFPGASRRQLAGGALLAALLAATACAPRRVSTAPAPELARSKALLARGDTIGALAVLDSLVVAHPRYAPGWYERGMLSWTVARTDWFKTVIKSPRAITLMIAADSSLRTAMQLAPDSARYAVSMGRKLLFDNVIWLRAGADEKFTAGLTAARRIGDHRGEAEALDELGMIEWRKFEGLADRKTPRVGYVPPTELDSAEQEFGAWFEYAKSFVPFSPPSGEGELTHALDNFTGAVRADPRYERARRHLVMALDDRERWTEAHAEVEDWLRVMPRSSFAWMARGLVLARRSRPREAGVAFDSALALMPREDRARFTSLARLLRAKDTAEYVHLDPARRAAMDEVFWSHNDPLTLTSENEHRVEFLARVAFADMRWTSDDFDRRGADSDRGLVWIRYGPPPLKIGSSRWLYPEEKLMFSFSGNPTYGTSRFTFGTLKHVEDAFYERPVGFSNVPVTRRMDSLETQVARFRARGDSTDLVLFADVPIPRMVQGIDVASGPVDMAFTARSADARLLARDSSRQIVNFARPDAAQKRAFNRRVAPQQNLVYRVEALQPDAMRAARAQGIVDIPTVSGFGMSDVLVGERVVPRDSGSARRWNDMLIVPSAGRLSTGRAFGVLWENYELRAGNGSNRYRVELSFSILDLTRGDDPLTARAPKPPPFIVRLIGGISDVVGLSAKGDDRVALSYVRERPASPVQLDYLTIELGDAPRGRYRLTVRITDLNANRTVESSRELWVVK